MTKVVGIRFKPVGKIYYFNPEDIELSLNDGVIVETLSSRLDSRISTQISEIAQKMLTGANDELE